MNRIVVLILTALSLSGCQERFGSMIVGDWITGSGDTICFTTSESGNKGESNSWAPYEISSDSILSLKPADGFGFSYKVLVLNDDTLKLKTPFSKGDGNVLVYTRR